MVNKRFTLLNENVENKKSPICENNNLLNYSTVCNLLNELYEENELLKSNETIDLLQQKNIMQEKEIERLTEMYFQKQDDFSKVIEQNKDLNNAYEILMALCEKEGIL